MHTVHYQVKNESKFSVSLHSISASLFVCMRSDRTLYFTLQTYRHVDFIMKQLSRQFFSLLIIFVDYVVTIYWNIGSQKVCQKQIICMEVAACCLTLSFCWFDMNACYANIQMSLSIFLRAPKIQFCKISRISWSLKKLWNSDSLHFGFVWLSTVHIVIDPILYSQFFFSVA